MAQLGADGRCIMRALQEELDDPDPHDCGRCSVCAGPRHDGPLDPELVREASLHLRSRPLVLDVKKMAPDAEGRMKKLPEDVRSEEGRALARLGDGGWDPLVQEGRRSGRFSDELVAAAAEAVRAWRVPVEWVAAIPSRRSGELVPGFAERLAAALGLPFAPVLERVGDHPPQRPSSTLRPRLPPCRSPHCHLYLAPLPLQTFPSPAMRRSRPRPKRSCRSCRCRRSRRSLRLSGRRWAARAKASISPASRWSPTT